MKRKELEAFLESMGFYFCRDRKHCMYSNGTIAISIPHHKEINIFLAKKIMKAEQKAYSEKVTEELCVAA